LDDRESGKRITQPIEFGKLESVSVRTAWDHEALKFTPWLAQNLDRLGDALGMQLEIVQTEAPVSGFAADIQARNALDGSTVLIENQLGDSDHKHLGQIMTYLAGLSAQTVVWVSPKFHDAHLSAIRWLNEHTLEPFAFFAVELRVVRIGDSPLAPLFEIIERPNDWERYVQARARESGALTNLGQFRKDFWTHFITRHPSEAESGEPTGDSTRWRKPYIGDFIVAQYLSQGGVGVFLRGRRGIPSEQTALSLSPFSERLETTLGAALGSNNSFFLSDLSLNTADRSNWDRMADFLHDTADKYVSALRQTVTGEA
jgi:hypothetical protein